MGKSNFVEMDFCQRVGVALTTPWITINLIHQLTNAVQAVADNLGRIASRGGDQLIADHEHAVILARNVTLNHDFAADFSRYRVSCFHLSATCEIHGYSFSLVAVLRLDHDRTADFTCGGPCIFGIRYRSS